MICATQTASAVSSADTRPHNTHTHAAEPEGAAVSACVDTLADESLSQAACEAIGIPPQRIWVVSNNGGDSSIYAANREHEAHHFLEVEFPRFKEQGYVVLSREYWPDVDWELAGKVVDWLAQQKFAVRVEVNRHAWLDLASAWALDTHPSGDYFQRASGIPATEPERIPEALCRVALKMAHAQAGGAR